MKLLDGKLYDPTTAVTSKATTAGLAMTAFDTTNLRLTVTVPKSGKILCRMGCQLHGATTLPSIVLGVLEGANLRGRRAPMVGGGNLAATGLYSCEAEFLITGLTPGASFVADAAYGVETGIASTAIKYGGPNNTTANDNFGGFQFELWDPDPYNADSSGRVQSDVRVMASGVITAAAHAAGAIDANAIADNAIDAGAIAANAITAAKIADGAITSAKAPNLDATVSSRMASFTLPANFSSLAVTAGGAVTVGTLPTIPSNWITAGGISAGAMNGKGDWLLSSGYTAPDNSGIATLTTRLSSQRATNLDNLDAQVSTRLATSGYTVPNNAGINAAAIDAAAIRSKTDELEFTGWGLKSDTCYINGVLLTGDGTAQSPFRPA